MSTQTEQPTIAPLQLSPGEVRFYNDEGYLVIPGLLNAEKIEQIKAEILEVMEVSGAPLERLKKAQSSKDKLIQSQQYRRDSALDSFVNSPELCRIAGQLMEGDASLYLPFTAVKSGGGGGVFHFHQDNQYTRFDGPGINLWFAISPMSPENGCLQVVPKSHLSGTIDAVENPDGDGHKTVAQDPTRFLPVRMNAGDCIAFSRLTLHGSGPNTTDEPRVAYAVQFHRSDVKAVWDGQAPRLLSETPRWTNMAPVDELTKPNAKSVDGH